MYHHSFILLIEHSTQPIIVNPGVHDLELKVDQVSKLRDIANELQDKFDYLVLAVKKSLENNSIDIEDAKMLIHGCLKRKARVVSQLLPCINILKKVNDFKSFFEFLSEYDFIGYLNYKLLKKLSKLVKDDNEINRYFVEYEKEYAKLLSAAAFQEFIPFFEKQSDLSPTAPLGLPYVSFCVEKPDSFTSAHDCLSTFDEFSWSQDMFLKQLQKKCIIITYAILPYVLDDVMRDLKDPVILKKLEDNDIRVVELPQEEEDFEGKKEDPQIESTAAKIEPKVDASSIMQTTSLEGKISTTSTTTLRPETASIGKEVKSSSLGRDLIKSIESDTKPEEVIGLLEAGADPNVTKHSFGGTPALIMAIEKGNTDIVKLLLEKGANPNATKYKSGSNPALIVAIEKNNIGVVDVLLEKGADPNIGFDTYKGTPLHHASETGDANIIKLLITKGNADVNAVDERKRTPLFHAIESGSVEAVDILLTNGAKTDVVSEDGETLLHCAGESGKVEMLEFWIKRGEYDVNIQDKRKRTPLLNAVKSGSVEAVDILLINGARTDVVSDVSIVLAFL
uniref:Uncharacterized protein n=1 Tax=Amphimedon queenslandica TaxID=400682 RepID=A0A1X7T6D1_AMPQE